MKTSIDSIMNKTRRYWYDDGFAEIAIGLLFTIIGLGLFVQATAEGPWYIIALVATFTLVGMGAFFVKGLVNQMKERVTYPRTGYVEYDEKPDPRARRLVIAFPMLVGILVLLLPETFSVMGSVVGLLMGIILTFIGYNSAVGRFVVAGLVAVAIGVLSSTVAPEDVTSTAFVFVGTGITLLLSGSIILMNYLRQNPSNPSIDEESA